LSLANLPEDDDVDRSSDIIKKEEKEMSKGQQEVYKQEMQGQTYELNKGSESEREKSTKRPRTGV
jgi:hypothetical protein